MAPTKPDSSRATQHRNILAPVSTGIRKYTAHPPPLRIDLDKYCGVICKDTSSPCLNKLRDCKTHSKVQKLDVAGRTPLPNVDLDKQCGVDVDGCPCPKKLRDCQTHSRVQKRAVAGRSCSYDMLIVAPEWAASSRVAHTTVDNGEGSSKDWPRVKAQIERERAAAVDRSTTPQVDIPVSPVMGKGKHVAEDSEASGLSMNIPVRPKGKKRGQKLGQRWRTRVSASFLSKTALTDVESAVARDIREYAGHKIAMIEHLEVARKIVEKVRGWE